MDSSWQVRLAVWVLQIQDHHWPVGQILKWADYKLSQIDNEQHDWQIKRHTTNEIGQKTSGAVSGYYVDHNTQQWV